MKTKFKVKCKLGTALIDTETGWIENYDLLYSAVEDCFNYWLRKEAPAAVMEENPCGWNGAVEMAIYAIADYCKRQQRDITSAAFLHEVRVTSYLQ